MECLPEENYSHRGSEKEKERERERGEKIRHALLWIRRTKRRSSKRFGGSGGG